jgi:hypothetical protein
VITSLHNKPGKQADKRMNKAREICITLLFYIVIQFITACGKDGDGYYSIQADTNTGASENVSLTQETANTGGMYDTSTPGVQNMQSLNYIAEGQITFGATREVYASSGKYHMQSQMPILSTSH